jgi:hypothetical protein
MRWSVFSEYHCSGERHFSGFSGVDREFIKNLINGSEFTVVLLAELWVH